MTKQWHCPTYRYLACARGIDREAGDGYLVNTTCTCPELDGGGDCAHCQAADEFSARPCEVCGTPLAGPRELVTRIHPREENIDYIACPDCVYMVEYGQLDDMTMLEVDDETARRA